MNKFMMTGIAAVGLCGAVFATVESANIVGYQESATAAVNTFTGAINTFRPISGDTVKLGDFIVKGGDGSAWTGGMAGQFSLLFLNERRGTMMVPDAEEQIKAISEDAYSDFEGSDLAFTFYDGHWYLYDDMTDSMLYPMDAFEIPAGQGFILNAFSGLPKGAKLVYSGQVGTAYQYAVATVNTFVMSGNVAPIEMTLADFALTAADGSAWTGGMAGQFSLLFLNERRGTMMVPDAEAQIKAISEDAYSDFEGSDLAFTFYDGHWYLYDDMTDSMLYPMDAFKIPAGQGFILNAFSGLPKGVKIALPPAIAEIEK